MKRLKKLSASLALTACLMALGASSASATKGWADTMLTAEVMHGPGSLNQYRAYVPLTTPDDQDWYLINNYSSGSDYIHYSIRLFPPSGKDFKLQFVRVDQAGNILSIQDINENPSGVVERHSWYLRAGENAYYGVMPVGPNDFDPNNNYHLEFDKLN